VASLSANVAMGVAVLRQREPAPPAEPSFMGQLALDADQRARIEGLRSRLMASRLEHGRAIAEMRGRLTAAISHEREDPAAVGRALRALAEAQSGYQCDVVDHVLAVRAVLRPDQRPRFERMVSQQMGAGAASAACECLPAPREGGVH
jgi:Spy/CpxP family protein refolding chaperone